MPPADAACSVVTLSQYHVQDIAQVHYNAVRINPEPQTQFITQSLLGLGTDNRTLSGPLQPRKLQLRPVHRGTRHTVFCPAHPQQTAPQDETPL